MNDSGRSLGTAVALAVAIALVAVALGASGPATAQSSAVTVPNATVSSSNPAAGETFVVRGTVQNAANADGAFDLNDVYVQTPDGRSSVARDLGTLAPGTSTTVQIPVSVSDPGWHSLSFRVKGTDDSGQVRNLEHPVPVNVGTEETSQLAMAATADDLGPSGRTDLQVTVANGFDRAITGVDLQVDSEGLELPEPQRVASRLPPGNETTFTFPIRDVEPGGYTVSTTLRYTSANGDRQTIERDLSAVISPVSEPGTISLTGVEVTREGGELAIRGSASNEGTTDVTGVNVSVVPGETARPADSSATYFVGDVPASDFSSFDVRAVPQANDTVRIPIRVSYVVDGVRTNRTVGVSYSLSSNAEPDRGEGENGGGGPGLVAILGVLFVAGAAVVGWRRYR